MEEWETCRLEDLCSIEIGRTPARDDPRLWDQDRSSGNVWLSIADLLGQEAGVVSDSREYVSDQGAALCKLVPAGTLLLSFKLTLGRIAVAGRPVYTNEAIAALSIRQPTLLERSYLRFFLEAFDWDKASEGDHKIKGRTLNKAKLKEIRVLVPPPSEQRRIVAILDEAFEAIATAKASTEKNLRNAREVLARQLQATFSEPRPTWAASTLGATYDVRDGTHDSPKYHDRGWPLITSKNLRPDGLSFDDVKLIADVDYRKINGRSAVHKGDVLFAMIGTIGNPTVVEVEPNFAIKNVALFKVPEGQSGHYLRYYLSSQGVVSKMQSEAKGTTQKFVGLGYLRAFPVTVPPPVEQFALVRQLDDLAANTGRLEAICQQKLEALDELKKSLLHQAFTGQLTAKSTDRQLEAVA